MRNLLAKDISAFTKIIAKMELKESIKSIFDNKEKEKGAIVSEIIYAVIENYPKAENELFAFLANLQGTTKETIEEMPLNEFIDLIKELFSEKNFSFFKFAAK